MLSLQEKKALVNLFSSILIAGGYSYYTFVMHGSENLPRIDELKFWAQFFLIMIPVSIVSKIVIFIFFAILNGILSRKKEPDIVDELGRLIELKAMRNACVTFIVGFFFSMLVVVLDHPVSTMFIVLFSFGLCADIIGELSKIYFYRRGIR